LLYTSHVLTLFPSLRKAAFRVVSKTPRKIPLTCCSEPAIAYLDVRHPKCANILRNIKPTENTELLVGSTKERGACRVQFGEAVSTVLDKTSKEHNSAKVMVIDSDLESSTGLSVIHKKHPE